MLELLNPVQALGAVGDYLRAGGPVVVALLVATFVMWTLILERFIYFAVRQPASKAERHAQWTARQDHSSWYAHAVRERLISDLRIETQQYMNVIKILVLITPLLGLLGTVTGMIEVFQVITDQGSSDARLMAGGISRATIPTMTGLAVSLTGIFCISVLERKGARSVTDFGDHLEIHAAASTRRAQGEQPA